MIIVQAIVNYGWFAHVFYIFILQTYYLKYKYEPDMFMACINIIFDMMAMWFWKIESRIQVLTWYIWYLFKDL